MLGLKLRIIHSLPCRRGKAWLNIRFFQRQASSSALYHQLSVCAVCLLLEKISLLIYQTSFIFDFGLTLHSLQSREPIINWLYMQPSDFAEKQV